MESPYSNKTNMDALLSAINAATNSEISDIPLEVVEEPKFSIADLFTEGKRVKNELGNIIGIILFSSFFLVFA